MEIIMKVCSACKIEKNESEFCKNKERKDGLNHQCRECLSIRKKKSYKPEKYQTEEFKEKNRKNSEKFRRENPEKASIQSRKWSEKNREKRRQYQEKSRKNNLEKRAVNEHLKRYVKKGLIERGSMCQDCNKEGKMEAHHIDYSKPLEVQWLCRRCHMKRHRRS